MARRRCEFVNSRLRRSPPDRASAVPYGQAGENAMRFPRLAHRSAAAHKLHSTPQQDRINSISGNGQPAAGYRPLAYASPEAVQTIGTVAIITQPNDDTERMSPGVHIIRGYAWSGAGAIDQVDVSVDGGETWHSTHIEQPRDRFMWVRWSYRWDVRQKGTYTLMSRASDEVGRVQSHEPQYNNMRKNFSAIVGHSVTVA